MVNVRKDQQRTNASKTGYVRPEGAPDRPNLPPPDEQSGETDRKRPVFKTRLGCIIGCVWENHGVSDVFFSTTIYRIYKPEGSDTWLNASSFGRDDLPLVAKVADTLHSWIFAAQQGSDSSF